MASDIDRFSVICGKWSLLSPESEVLGEFGRRRQLGLEMTEEGIIQKYYGTLL